MSEVESAETTLGFSLPDDLRQLYTEIANGGFGPGSGLANLREAIKYYRNLLEDPKSEFGQTWPAHLFPFNFWDLGADCFDLNSSEIVYWDEESLADGPDEAVWKRSFRKQTDSLSEYLENWLSQSDGRRRGFDEQAREVLNVVDTGDREGVDAARLLVLQNSINECATTPEERAGWGLPEVGWDEALCELQGLDPKIYLKLIR